MGPKPTKKYTGYPPDDFYKRGDEFSDGAMSEEDSYDPSSLKPKPFGTTPRPSTSTPRPGTSTPRPGTSTPRPGTSTPRPGTLTHRHGTSTHQDQATNTDIVGFNQDKVFTRAFLTEMMYCRFKDICQNRQNNPFLNSIQWFIVVFTFLACAFCLTLYVRHIQVHYLAESLNDILNVTEDGQSYIDTGINNEMGVRIPVLMSNGTPTIIDDKVTQWVDKYINEHLYHLVSSLLKTQHKLTVEDKSNAEVRKLVEEVVLSTKTAETVHDLVTQKLTKYHKNNGENTTPMVQNQIEEVLNEVINNQITVEGPKAVKNTLENENVKSYLTKTLNDAISKHVSDISPPLIKKYTDDETLIQDIDNKLKDLFDKQLKLVDMTGKVEEELVKERLSQKIIDIAADILESEFVYQADPKIKKKLDDLINSYSEQFEKDSGETVRTLQSKVKEAEERIVNMKKGLDVQKQESMEARQDKQANLLVLLSAIVIVLLLFVFWIYQRPHTKGSTSASTREPMTRKHLEDSQISKRSDLVAPKRGNLHAQNKNDSPDSQICIILFNPKLQGEITTLLKNLKMQDFNNGFCTIRKVEHTNMLPICQVFLMICEFNERHVIIEQPGLGLGDLHRKTYYKTMEINGNLIILYIHDPGSRNLRDEHYNEKIYCVKSQEELSGLRDTGRFFSCYKELTPFQINKLQEKFNEFLTN